MRLTKCWKKRGFELHPLPELLGGNLRIIRFSGSSGLPVIQTESSPPQNALAFSIRNFPFLEFSLNSVQIYVIRLISWRGSGIRLEDAKRLFD